MPRASSRDVAAYAGVSITTVSHVINGTRAVNAETRERVLEAIRVLNYRPNAVARGLATNSTREIGLVVSDIRNPFFTAVARGVEDMFVAHGYNTIFCNTDEDPEREEANLRLLAGQQIDGLIIAPTGDRCESLLSLAAMGVPIVQLDRTSPGLAAPAVKVDNEEGAYLAVRYLIGLGHRQIAYLMGLDAVTTQLERLEGWRRALTEAGLPAGDDLIVRADPRFFAGPAVFEDEPGEELVGEPAEHARGLPPALPNPDSEALHEAAQRHYLASAREVLGDLLTQADRPSALFVATNQLTLGALYAFNEYGVRFPEDMSLVSFDDQDWAALFRPPLTVVRQPTYRLGQTAARLLMRMIRGEPADSPPPLAVELVIRASCCPPGST